MAMLDALDDGEFWLPPQFLADDDDDFLAAAAAEAKRDLDQGSNPCDRFGACGGYSSLGSPVESAFGSTEAKRDEQRNGSR